MRIQMMHGGARKGAGRPRVYGEKTKPMRIPLNFIKSVQALIENKGFQLPLYESKISAGFPSPAEDDSVEHLTLDQLLIKNRVATFLVRVSGCSMINAGIYENDILIVDRSIEPQSGKIVIAAINGEFTVKKLQIDNNKILLMPENPDFTPIEITEENNVHIWGVVTTVIHSFY